METDSKAFDAVATMRKIRDGLSRRFKGMSFDQQKREMQKLAKRKPGEGARTRRGTP